MRTALTLLLAVLPAWAGDLETALSQITVTGVSNTEYYLTVTLGERYAGDANSLAAQKWIAGQFTNIGLTQLTNTFYFAANDSGTMATNIVGIIPGKDPSLSNSFIVYHCHLDTVDNVVGANDNASGCAAMLETAKAFKAIENSVSMTIMFVAFDWEEQSIAGSKWFTDHPPIQLANIAYAVNYDGAADLTHTNGQLSIVSSNVLTVASNYLLTATAKYAAIKSLRWAQEPASTDSKWFITNSVPALFFYTSQPDRHAATDTMDSANFSLTDIVVVAKVGTELGYQLCGPAKDARIARMNTWKGPL